MVEIAETYRQGRRHGDSLSQCESCLIHGSDHADLFVFTFVLKILDVCSAQWYDACMARQGETERKQMAVPAESCTCEVCGQPIEKRVFRVHRLDHILGMLSLVLLLGGCTTVVVYLWIAVSQVVGWVGMLCAGALALFLLSPIMIHTLNKYLCLNSRYTIVESCMMLTAPFVRLHIPWHEVNRAEMFATSRKEVHVFRLVLDSGKSWIIGNGTARWSKMFLHWASVESGSYFLRLLNEQMQLRGIPQEYFGVWTLKNWCRRHTEWSLSLACQSIMGSLEPKITLVIRIVWLFLVFTVLFVLVMALLVYLRGS